MKKDKALALQEPEFELKKHVATIHSSNKLSLLQRKIANALLYNAYAHLKEKDEHVIHLASLCRLIGYVSNDHKTIKRSLVNLLSTVIEWNLVDGERLDDEETWNASSIIADASIKGAICTYSYSKRMRQLLHHPQMYGRLDMIVQAQFRSSYGLALYENCNRYQDIGQTPWFEMMQFRKLMGVEDHQYRIFRDFKTRVINKAVEEVNAYSSLKVEPMLRKENRQVVAIQFLIQKVSKLKLLPTQADANDELIQILKQQFSLSDRGIKSAIKNYTTQFIMEKINLVLSSASYKAGQIRYLSRYLMSALKHNYQEAQAYQIPRTKKSRMPVPSIDVVKKDELERDEINQLEFHRRAQVVHLMKIVGELPRSQKKKLLGEFERYMDQTSRGVYANIYVRDGLKNPLIQDELYFCLKRTNHPLLLDLISYETWRKQKKK